MTDPRLFMRAATLVEGRIADGTYSPGQRLNIGLIADELDVERGTVSRAMGILRDRGLVTFWQGLGWYVSGEGQPPAHLTRHSAPRRYMPEKPSRRPGSIAP
jgi:DNA-binding GntR family transcriptional regulator